MDSSWNPYWDEIGFDKVGFDQLQEGMVVQVPYTDTSRRRSCFDYDFNASLEWRRSLVPRYAWTISHPQTVAFVVDHSDQRILDPLAGTGYWARLLAERGKTVHAYDLRADDLDANKWHPGQPHWTTVLPGNAPVVTAEAGPEPTLLLSWPPMNDPLAYLTLTAYQGDTLIYMGDPWCAFTGDQRFAQLLDADWTQRESHTPVQWFGTHDYVCFYERKR